MKYKWAYIFILPNLLIFTTFYAFPIGRAILLAFQEDGNFVGLDNFKTIFKDRVFWLSMKNTFIYTALTVPANVFISLIIASLIHPLSTKMRVFFRAAYYLPGVASIVVISMIWKWLFDYNFGLLNQILNLLGIESIPWLTNPSIALYSIIMTTVLSPPGGPIIIYLAALDSIPRTLYDAGKIDGAGALRRWWSISVPLLTPTTLFLLITTTIASFQIFAKVLILTDGGPGYSTTVLVHRIYTTAFRDFEFGVASAMALLLFIVIMSASIIQFRFFRSSWEY